MRGQDVSSADLDIRRYIVRVAAEIGELLEDDLAGTYLYGSLATGSFYRSASDIDFLIVVRKRLSPALREKLAETLVSLNDARPMPGEIDVTVVQESYLKNYEHPVPYELRFDEEFREAMRSGSFDFERDRTDAGLAPQFLAVKQRGVQLTGARPVDAVGAIPWHAFMEAVVADFDSSGRDSKERPAAAVLNACRTLHDATLPKIQVVSKEEAAQWALYILPEHFRPLVRDALQEHRGGPNVQFDPERVARLRRHVEDGARATFEKVRDTGEDE